MKTSKEITKWLLENATNEQGQIELNGLELNVDLVIRNCNIKNYASYYNEVEGDYYSHSNKVEGNYYSRFNEVENNQYYPKHAIVNGKEYQVDLTDNYYLIIEKSTTKNGVTIIKGFNRSNNKIWLYKNSFVGYHGSTKHEAKEGFKRKLKGFEKNIELIETIKEAGKITMLDYHNLTGACDLGISDFAERIGKPDRDYLTLAELKEHLKPNDSGYNMIIKWLKEESK